MDGQGAGQDALGVVADAAIGLGEDGRVAWVGPAGKRPVSDAPTVDLGGAVVFPGFVDAHTHIVYAGDRTRDFALRCGGCSYEEVAAQGGGIRLTVAATRAASHDELFESARERLEDLVHHGVTTVEVKSGYGLSVADDLKMLEVVKRLGDLDIATVVPTALPAHVVPDEYRGCRGDYVDIVIQELLPEVANRGLARFVDVFCDEGAYELDECLRILEQGRALGLGLKVHGEQLTRTGISGAAAAMGATSADHLEHASPEDMAAMAETGTTAVLLPGAALFLGGRDRAPARQLIEHGVGVALATDCNPGTCPSRNMPLMTTLGCTYLGLTPAESVQGVTSRGAAALGLDDGTGTIQVGGPADLVVCDMHGWQHLPYALGNRTIRQVWRRGRVVAA